jgi:hypothetical protein
MQPSLRPSNDSQESSALTAERLEFLKEQLSWAISTDSWREVQQLNAEIAQLEAQMKDPDQEFLKWLEACIEEEQASSEMSVLWEEKLECGVRKAAYTEVLEKFKEINGLN